MPIAMRTKLVLGVRDVSITTAESAVIQPASINSKPAILIT
jgi:hypothetical protein